MVPQFAVSALLKGHTKDVRAISSSNPALGPGIHRRIFSSSRDSSVRIWKYSEDNEKERWSGKWAEEAVLSDHEGYVNAVCWVPPSDENVQGWLATAGSDTVIQIYNLDDLPGPLKPIQTLYSHEKNVCSLHCSSSGKTLVSGGWDGRAVVWIKEKKWRSLAVLGDEFHGGSVWDALVLEVPGWEGSIITACADSIIRLFKPPFNGAPIIFKGHQGPVRSLAKIHPQDPTCPLFASASNDMTIRLWTIASQDILTVLEGSPEYIYSLDSFDIITGETNSSYNSRDRTDVEGGLVSGGEGGQVRIWDEREGDEIQLLEIPAESVWSVHMMSDGELVVGSSDHFIWIFSPHSKADEETVKLFNSMVETKLSKAVLAKAENADSSVEKKDFIVDVDIRDNEPPLVLSFNRSDDLKEIATEFVKAHSLPESYIDRIIDFMAGTVSAS